jgi:hypothetical protein
MVTEPKTAEAEQKLATLRQALATIEAADEAARQVYRTGQDLSSSEGREISNYASHARELFREAQKVMIVAVYDQEKRIGR